MDENVDYLAIGHISRDVTPAGELPGGTVAYSGLTAGALGCRTAVVTSAGPELDVAAALPGLQVKTVPAAHSTRFENVYTPAGRHQIVHGVAGRLGAADVPARWQRAPIVHLAPIADEVDSDLVSLFSNSQVGLTPQGWMRRWRQDGQVVAQAWPAAAAVLPLAAATVISQEDLPDESWLAPFRRWSPLLVLTQGRHGCTVFCGGEMRQLPAPPVPEVEMTGAGDVFAAAFFIRLWQTRGNPWEAARFANDIAAQSVTAAQLSAKIAAVRRWWTAQAA